MYNSKLWKTIAALLTVILMFAALCPASLAAFDVKINTSSSRVYAKPSAASVSVRGKLGAKLTCVSYSDGWARVKYKGNYGYMQIKHLNLVKRITAYTKQAAKVYSKAGGAGKITSVAKGTTLYVNGFNGSYARVQNKSGSATGYIRTNLLSTNAAYKKSAQTAKSSASSASTESSSKGKTKAERLIDIAKSYIGTPYGDNAPKSFNCSTFVRYCYGKIGYSMKTRAAIQATDSRMKKISSMSALKMGDVLCFDTDGDGTCDHTAMYISGSSFIEASQKANRVQINHFSSYYNQAFMWARRVK